LVPDPRFALDPAYIKLDVSRSFAITSRIIRLSWADNVCSMVLGLKPLDRSKTLPRRGCHEEKGPFYPAISG
jgi:hypothetical protein